MYNHLHSIPECDRRADRRTDRQTSCHGIVRAMHMRRAVKIAFFAFWRQDQRWQISAILDFRGPIIRYLKSPCTTCYRSSIALNCLVFEKITFLHFGDRQTDEQMDSTDALSHSRCREQQLDNVVCTGRQMKE